MLKHVRRGTILRSTVSTFDLDRKQLRPPDDEFNWADNHGSTSAYPIRTLLKLFGYSFSL